MCDQHHDHKPDDVKVHEDAHIAEFIAKPSISLALSTIRMLRSPVDAMEHTPGFKNSLEGLGLYLMWGKRAFHKFQHAYCFMFAEEEGSWCTIITNHNLDQYDDSCVCWKRVDLFLAEEDLTPSSCSPLKK